MKLKHAYAKTPNGQSAQKEPYTKTPNGQGAQKEPYTKTPKGQGCTKSGRSGELKHARGAVGEGRLRPVPVPEDLEPRLRMIVILIVRIITICCALSS